MGPCLNPGVSGVDLDFGSPKFDLFPIGTSPGMIRGGLSEGICYSKLAVTLSAASRSPTPTRKPVISQHRSMIYGGPGPQFPVDFGGAGVRAGVIFMIAAKNKSCAPERTQALEDLNAALRHTPDDKAIQAEAGLCTLAVRAPAKMPMTKRECTAHGAIA